jgi:RNA 2',3'-cyclic 3'-phosphodiesterase
VRLFIAANFDASLQLQLYHAAQPLRAAVPDLAWIAPDRLHVTLKFLGEREPELVPRLRDGLRAALGSLAPCHMRLAGFGAFPNFLRARVVWMGAEPAQSLSRIAGAVDEVCAGVGVAREQRPFRAHVTLGRVKRPLPAAAARRLEQLALGRHEAFPWYVRQVDIMHSVLGRGGPAYTVLESIALGAAAPGS